MYETANKLKQDGNNAVRKGEYKRAIALYAEALEVIDLGTKGSYCFMPNLTLLRSMLWGNISIAQLKAGKYGEAAEAAEQALRVSEGSWVKGYLRLLSVAPHLDTLDRSEIIGRGLRAALYIPTKRPSAGAAVASSHSEAVEVIMKLVDELEEIHREEGVVCCPGDCTPVTIPLKHLCRVGLCPIQPVDTSFTSTDTSAQALMRETNFGLYVEDRDLVPPYVLSTPSHVLCTIPTKATHREFLMGFILDKSHDCAHKPNSRQYYWGLGAPCKAASAGGRLIHLESGYWGIHHLLTQAYDLISS